MESEYNHKNVKYGQLCCVIESQLQDTPWLDVMTSVEDQIVACLLCVT